MAAQQLPKGEFARLIGVTPGRVSQYISEGKISGAALVGEGRAARISVEEAKRQLGLKLDVGQRFGNGAATNLEPELALEGDEEPARPARAAANPVRDPFAEQYQREKLESLQRKNRREAQEEFEQRGTYVRAADSQAALNGMAGALVTVFEAGLADIAQALAAKFEIPQRDVLHAMRAEFRAVRAKAAEQSRRRMAAMPRLVLDQAAAETAEAA